MRAWFARGGAPTAVPLVRLGDVRPVHAMTVHRSQGSQFDRVTVVLPTADSPLATRETLYTAITRAVRTSGSSARRGVRRRGRPTGRPGHRPAGAPLTGGSGQLRASSGQLGRA